ncbi:MAG: NAD(P)H-hydrate dehydratase [Gemmatimonadales bacterium]
MPIPILSPEQSAAWDHRAEAEGIALSLLMEAAGRAAAGVLAERFPFRLGAGVLVAAGPGNNGGDGWVTARVLHRHGVPVWVTGPPGEQSPLCREMAERARKEGVREVAGDGPWPNVGLVVDALLGTGAKGAPRAPVQALVDRIADLEVPVLAMDGPTGLDLATGASHAAVAPAAVTVTFGGLRRGHLLARDEVGDVVVVDIGHPAMDPAWPLLVTDEFASSRLPPFEARVHKGIRGRVVVIGGDAGMSGALRLASRAAFAAGAGLVHAVAPESTIAALLTAEPDLQTLAHPLEGPLDPRLLALLERSDAVVIGPGLGRAAGRRAFVEAVLAAAPRAVVDADALVAFAGGAEGLAAAAARIPLVLTPHAGEFRALFPSHADGMELDPWAGAAAAAQSAGATVLLKGVPTVVARKSRPSLCVASGNPGLATGGSGDLLSGFVGALLGQGYEPELAAALGAQILGRAADLGARRHTARGLRPMDVLAALPDLWRAWESWRVARPAPRPPVLLELLRPATV